MAKESAEISWRYASDARGKLPELLIYEIKNLHARPVVTSARTPTSSIHTGTEEKDNTEDNAGYHESIAIA